MQRLDTETEEDRHARLGQLFSSISKPLPGAGASRGPDPGYATNRETYAVPASDALARAKAFLPLLQSSNAELLAKAKADPNGVNIEHTDGQDQVIAMDLGLGVYDVNGEAKGGIGPEIPYDQQRTQDSRGEDAENQDMPEQDGLGAERGEETGTGGAIAIMATPFVREDLEAAVQPTISADESDTSMDLSLDDPQFREEQAVSPEDGAVVDSDSDVDHYSDDAEESEDADSDSQDYSSMSDPDDVDDYENDSN